MPPFDLGQAEGAAAALTKTGHGFVVPILFQFFAQQTLQHVSRGLSRAPCSTFQRLGEWLIQFNSDRFALIEGHIFALI